MKGRAGVCVGECEKQTQLSMPERFRVSKPDREFSLMTTETFEV